MSLMAEVVVEEWLNRQGYFTIRGIKLGVDELDIIAIKPLPDGSVERRHIEVQVSMRPVSYICRVPKAIQKATGKTANSSKRSVEELEEGVKEWVEKKFRKDKKKRLLASLGDGTWTSELVVHNVRDQSELDLIQSHGVQVLKLVDVLEDLRSPSKIVPAAAGADLLELMHITSPPILADALATGEEPVILPTSHS